MNNKYVRVDRQSVCMGDDCTAPNEKLLSVCEKDMLSDIFQKISVCLPQMCDVIWAVDSGKKVIGYIITDANNQVRYELCLKDQVFCELGIEAMHCSYFHQKSFEYQNEKNGRIIEKYPECRNLFDKVRCCMNERFLYELKVNGGSLCIWGEWFGRPCDNFHTIETVQWRNNEVILQFKDEEFLSVSSPVGIVNEKAHLVIRDASQILWTWYPCGREHTYENLYVRQYTKRADGTILQAEGKRCDIKNSDGTVFYPVGDNAVYLG